MDVHHGSLVRARDLSRDKFVYVVNYLDVLRELWLEGDVMKRSGRTRPYYYGNLSMIPDQRRYRSIAALLFKGVGPETAFRILGRMHVDQDDFCMDLLKAKIHFFRARDFGTRQYWDDKNSGRY